MNANAKLNHDFDVLRRRYYDARVVSVRQQHPDLMVIRVRPDAGMPSFSAGQYTTLGLGDWEPCVEDTGEQSSDSASLGKLIRRAYSVSASLLDDAGRLIRADECDYLEFYVALVRHSGKPTPSLTPRLFHLQPDQRLFCATHLRGNYTLKQLDASKNVVLAATGTGEAPHNAMLAELLSQNHRGKIASVVCVRYERDLAYLSMHRELERRYSNYRYITLTTREPVNLDPTVHGYVGKRYLQDFFASGTFEKIVGWSLDPADSEVFLCGSPEMIGASFAATNTATQVPTSKGMVNVLESRGFRADTPRVAGNIHFERYW